MVLFNYENLSFFAKHSREIWIGGLIFAGVMLIVSLLVSFFKRNNSSGIVKFLRNTGRVILSFAVSAGIVVCFVLIWQRHQKINLAYERYTEMYENGEFKIVSGKVEDFTPASHSKSFTLDGVRFTIYSNNSYKQHRDPSEDGPALYYCYTEAYTTSYTTTSQYGGTTTHTQYVPENCVILGENQMLEIHYVEEFGQNRILFIKELSE